MCDILVCEVVLVVYLPQFEMCDHLVSCGVGVCT